MRRVISEVNTCRDEVHCQQVHEHLVQEPRDQEYVQAGEIWAKAQGQVIWLAMEIMVNTYLWLVGVIAKFRD